ncbi:MAG: hypothetical protein WDO68_16510 [Gammaproteobacteria bacterium]
MQENVPMRMLIAVVAVFLVSACQVPRSEFQLCEINHGVFDREPTVIDLENGVVRGKDVSNVMRMARSDFVSGFVKPFPLVLPARPPNEVPAQWDLEGYHFTMSAPRSDPTALVLIHAEPVRVEAGTVPTYSSVVFSPTKGLLAVQVSSHAPDRVITMDLVSCGTEELQASSFH